MTRPKPKPDQDEETLGAARPVEFEPATDEPDDDEEEEDQGDPSIPAPAPAPTPAPEPQPHGVTTSRRGFLGAAAGLVAGVAASAAAPAQEAPAAPPAAVPEASQGASPDLGAMMASFLALMDEREEKLLARFEERLAAAVAPTTNGVVHESPTELAAAPGQYPQSLAGLAQQAREATSTVTEREVQKATLAQPPRMVAFIPKDDPNNPRQTTFKTWINGRELRSKRGQVMILTLGHGIDLAKNGHGNCVDIAAMQGVGVAAPLEIPRNPDFARPANWDGMPMTAGSSFPVARIA